MKKLLTILLTTVFLYSQAFGQPLGFLTFSSVNVRSMVLSMTNKGSEQRQSTKATVGQGNITIGGVLNPEIEGLNRDISNTQETGNVIITGALEGSITVDNRLLLGFLMKREVKDKEGNTREASRDFYRTLYSKLNAIYCLHNKPFIQQLYIEYRKIKMYDNFKVYNFNCQAIFDSCGKSDFY